MTGVEYHVNAIQEAIREARAEGYLFQAWPDEFPDGTWDSISVDLMLVRNKRGGDGVMRIDESAKVETVWI